ncbi:MAG: hypothetical protein ACYDA3_08990 [Gaiellaceae bacterium]
MCRRSASLAAAWSSVLVLAAGAHAGDPGRLPQTRTLPSATTQAFRVRMTVLWRAVVDDAPAQARAAFFPRSAYLQVKAIPNAAGDYRTRLLANFAADIHAAHRLVARGGNATLLEVRVPQEASWIGPGGCYNKVGYWHAPGSRLVYRQDGRVRSFGIYSLISWRGQWYVVHLGPYDRPGNVVAPSNGLGAYGPPGGC